MNDLYVISGVSGMTGNELARQIINNSRGFVIGFDNFFCSDYESIRDILDSDCFSFYKYDINNKEEMKAIEKEVIAKKAQYNRTVYINCAAIVHTEYFYKVNETFETNLIGMKSFLEQAIRVEADSYINCSTSEVYSMKSFEENGVKEADFITLANAEHSQRTSYACEKLMTEFFMKDAVDNKKIRGCSIRFANVYSKNEKYSKHIIPHIAESLLSDGTVTLLENSKKNKRTFLHNIDSCSSVLALIDSENALDGTVYNVATDEEISIIDLTYMIAEKLNIKNPKIIFSGFRESDPERRLLNTEKIRIRTSWVPKISLDKGIDMLIKYKKGKNE